MVLVQTRAEGKGLETYTAITQTEQTSLALLSPERKVAVTIKQFNCNNERQGD